MSVMAERLGNIVWQAGRRAGGRAGGQAGRQAGRQVGICVADGRSHIMFMFYNKNAKLLHTFSQCKNARCVKSLLGVFMLS
jgi:hypothetical protein